MSKPALKSQPSLATLVSPWFLFLTVYRRNFAELPKDPQSIRQQLQKLLADSTLAIENDRGLAENFAQAKYALVYCADEILSRCQQASGGPGIDVGLEMAEFRTNIGGAGFYDRCVEASTMSAEVREVFLQCLCLGFEGKFVGKPHRIQEVMQGLYQRHEQELSRKLEQKVYPAAYDNTLEAPPTKPPLMTTAAIGALALGAMIVLLVGGISILNARVEDLGDRADAIAKRASQLVPGSQTPEGNATEPARKGN